MKWWPFKKRDLASFCVLIYDGTGREARIYGGAFEPDQLPQVLALIKTDIKMHVKYIEIDVDDVANLEVKIPLGADWDAVEQQVSYAIEGAIFELGAQPTPQMYSHHMLDRPY